MASFHMSVTHPRFVLFMWLRGKSKEHTTCLVFCQEILGKPYLYSFNLCTRKKENWINKSFKVLLKCLNPRKSLRPFLNRLDPFPTRSNDPQSISQNTLFMIMFHYYDMKHMAIYQRKKDAWSFNTWHKLLSTNSPKLNDCRTKMLRVKLQLPSQAPRRCGHFVTTLSTYAKQ